METHPASRQHHSSRGLIPGLIVARNGSKIASAPQAAAIPDGLLRIETRRPGPRRFMLLPKATEAAITEPFRHDEIALRRDAMASPPRARVRAATLRGACS